MRVVYSLGKKVDVSASVYPYVGPCAEPPKWRDGRCTVTFFPEGSETAEVEIEAGSVVALRDALRNAAGILDDLLQYHTYEAEDLVAHSAKCGFCDTYHDVRRPPEWGHADGHGNRCLGDGTSIMGERQVQVRQGDDDPTYEGAWVSWPFSTLRAGDEFREANPTDDVPAVLVAIEDPKRHFDGYRAYLGVRFTTRG